MNNTITYLTLNGHIQGMPTEDDFQFKQMNIPELAEDQFIALNQYISVDPGTRMRLSGKSGYAAPVRPGGLVSGFAIAKVISSRNSAFLEGDMVAMMGGWSTHSIFSGTGFALKLPDVDISNSAFLGILGIPGMTAYFGLKRVGHLKAGDHVLVTSAAGPVGIDLLFDNVGNKMIDTVIPQMRLNGRIVVSGQTADYNTPIEKRHGIKNTTEFIGNRLSMQGMVVFDDIPNFTPAQKELSTLIQRQELIYREEIITGLDALPSAFCGLFIGDNFGRRLIKLE